MKRSPYVAGQFYSASENSLKQEIGHLFANAAKVKKQEVKAVVSPHAGYMYSGQVAADVFSLINVPDTIIIIGPNHTGLGPAFSVFKQGLWHTPLGDVEIDEELAALIMKKCPLLQEDIKAHAYEHSVEVQIPFMQYLRQDFKIVPMVLSRYNLPAYRELGKAIASAIKELKRNALIVASSDMTHHEERIHAEKKDKIAIEEILKLNEEMLVEKVENLDISMCGYIPTAVTIVAAKELGAKQAVLAKYLTSGDVTGDYDSVVGYAGLIIK
ncbi:MAG: AmmeMemoRadiSam system protein B [Candidatus Omnitrophica bacterium]|nr:AmmeMemoRadiSam system protein B [Candidatus Omnitrophota bacterium]